MGKITLNQTGAQVQSDLNFTEKMFTVYDPSSTYASGNVVRYSDKLYKCNTNNTTGTWNSSKWDEVKLNNLLGGTQLYKHHIVDSGMWYEFILINNDPNQIDFSTNNTYAKVKQYLDQNPFTSFMEAYAFSPVLYDSNHDIFYWLVNQNNTVICSNLDDWDLSSTTDTVTPL